VKVIGSIIPLGPLVVVIALMFKFVGVVIDGIDGIENLTLVDETNWYVEGSALVHRLEGTPPISIVLIYSMYVPSKVTIVPGLPSDGVTDVNVVEGHNGAAVVVFKLLVVPDCEGGKTGKSVLKPNDLALSTACSKIVLNLLSIDCWFF
jgi:hypothetical protein